MSLLCQVLFLFDLLPVTLGSENRKDEIVIQHLIDVAKRKNKLRLGSERHRRGLCFGLHRTLLLSYKRKLRMIEDLSES